MKRSLRTPLTSAAFALLLAYPAFGQSATPPAPKPEPKPSAPPEPAPAPDAAPETPKSEEPAAPEEPPKAEEPPAEAETAPKEQPAEEPPGDDTAAPEEQPVAEDATEPSPEEAPAQDPVEEASAPAPVEEAEAAPFDPAADHSVQPGEADVWIPGEEPNRPAPPGKGVVWGRLLEGETSEGAIEAEVKVNGVAVFTDLDGYYRLELAPGVYSLQIFYPLFEAETLGNVAVTLGKVSRVDAKLKAQEGAVEEVVIEEEAVTESVEGLALARQRSVAQGDAIGREEISKGTAGNAADAAQRVVGANIVGGRFVYVRGLGERYTNSLLGGYPLPSPEPDKAAVPLDVFPTTVLDSITIVKTATPDMPADFAGGSVQIETRSVPSDPLFNVSVTGGFNPQSTFQKRLTYKGSRTDFLGFDSGARQMASSVPTDRSVDVTGENPLSADEVTTIGKDINSPMHASKQTTPVDHSFSIVGGDSWKLGDYSNLGFLASVNYSRSYEVIEGEIIREFQPTSANSLGYEPLTDFKVDTGADKIRWGTFGKVELEASRTSKLSLSVLHSQLADDYAKQYGGYRADTQRTYEASQLDWIERGMTFGVLSGRHSFVDLNRAEFGWDVSLAEAFRSEPDRRDTVYIFSDRLPSDDGRASGWQIQNSDESGRHFFSQQNEVSYGGKVDWRQPVMSTSSTAQLAVKSGALANVKKRDFSVRRLQMEPSGSPQGVGDPRHCVGEEYELDCSEALFQDENIPEYISASENPQPGDAYDGWLNVFGGYGMIDYEPTQKIRLAGGVRVEHTDQGITPQSVVGDDPTVAGSELRQTDVLPSVSASYSLTKKSKLRASYAKTLARPTVREIAPFSFSSYFGGRSVTGNPDLEITRIYNADLRYEFFPDLTEVLAGSVFYKYLDKPIEQTLIPSADSSTVVLYENADKANLVGVELEARKSLVFIAPALRDLALVSNLTLTYSRTEVDQTGTDTITNLVRPLFNQAPWVVNVALDYENKISGTNARIAYNVNGRSLTIAGTEGIDDGYLQSRHSLDLSVGQKFWEHWSAKAQIENLINDDYLTTVGSSPDGTVWNQYRTGAVYSIGVGYEL